MIRCDLCGGDPQCAKYCPMNVIEVVPDEEVPEVRKRGVRVLYGEAD